MVLGGLSALAMEIFLLLLKPNLTGLEAILAPGFVGSYITGVIMKEEGAFRGLIFGILVDVCYYIIAFITLLIGGSEQTGHRIIVYSLCPNDSIFRT